MSENEIDLDSQAGETISIKYELQVWSKTVYECCSKKPTDEVIKELKEKFAYLLEADKKPRYQIFKTIKSKVE